MGAISVFRWTGYGTYRIWSSHNGGYDEFYLFDPEGGGDMLLRNVGGLSTDYTALYPRRENSEGYEQMPALYLV
jgi:hypothetical protein